MEVTTTTGLKKSVCEWSISLTIILLWKGRRWRNKLVVILSIRHGCLWGQVKCHSYHLHEKIVQKKYCWPKSGFFLLTENKSLQSQRSCRWSWWVQNRFQGFGTVLLRAGLLLTKHAQEDFIRCCFWICLFSQGSDSSSESYSRQRPLTVTFKSDCAFCPDDNLYPSRRSLCCWSHQICCWFKSSLWSPLTNTSNVSLSKAPRLEGLWLRPCHTLYDFVFHACVSINIQRLHCPGSVRCRQPP